MGQVAAMGMCGRTRQYAWAHGIQPFKQDGSGHGAGFDCGRVRQNTAVCMGAWPSNFQARWGRTQGVIGKT
jgi:hypothetical protein